MGERGGGVAEIIAARLRDDNVPDQVASLITGALGGGRPDDGEPGDGRPDGSGRASGQARVFLRSIAVQAFRGIGPKATLHLPPGPGLTVVTGRNGSGKSSFAEAAELVLTGDNKRWSDRTAVWKEGWRNLNEPAETEIAVSLTEEGTQFPAIVSREWPTGAGLDSGQSYISVAGDRQPLAVKGWTRPLELYRPFLSYSELGGLISGRPTEMHDALQAILGLDVLTEAERTLAEARRSAETVAKQARQQLPGLLETLAAHPDERARTAENALSGRTWDLEALEALATSDETAASGLAGLLEQVARLTLPTVDDVAAAENRLAAARAAVAALAGTAAADARRLADLLSAALEHRQEHSGERCPVCGGRVLDEEWAAFAAASVTELRSKAATADAAYAELSAATRALGQVVPAKPAVLSSDLGADVDPAVTAKAWDEFLAGPGVPAFEALAAAVEELRTAAGRVLRERAAAWQPVAVQLAAWSKVAVESNHALVRAGDLRKALDWLRGAGREVRNARLAPFAQTSARVWETLRQESNVELGPITLTGAGPARKVALDVTIDGVPGAALSVMSQGELHALGLALFLPRVLAEESPFGFVVIDDPVQAMDPAKVDGLARVLCEVAASRQVVVFTHDDRLPAALRQLELPATVLAVTRLERSMVSVRPVSDPVARYLDDARAMARTSQLPETVRGVAVAGLCRGAIEAACVDVVRSRDLGAGIAHAVVDESLEAASHSLQDMVALALLGSVSRGGEVVARLRSMAGNAGVNAFWDAKKGVHDPQHGELKRFVENTESLCRALRS